jgi:hypothetical protein
MEGDDEEAPAGEALNDKALSSKQSEILKSEI